MLFEKADHRTLGLLRIATYGMWLVLFFIRSPLDLAYLPPEMFVARGIVGLLSSDSMTWFLSPGWLSAFNFFSVLVLVAALAGVRPFWFLGALASMAILWYDGLVKGFGEYVNHGVAAWLFMALVLPFFPAADGFKIGTATAPLKNLENYRYPILLMTVMVLLCYTFIGVHRFIYGGLEIFNGDALRSWLLYGSQDPAPMSFRLGIWVANSPPAFLVYQIGFVLVTLMECAALYCLFNRRFSCLWLAFMILFHFLSLFTLNIFFWENIILLGLLFAPAQLFHAMADGSAFSWHTKSSSVEEREASGAKAWKNRGLKFRAREKGARSAGWIILQSCGLWRILPFFRLKEITSEPSWFRRTEVTSYRFVGTSSDLKPTDPQVSPTSGILGSF